VTVDGRRLGELGLSIPETAAVARSLGMQEAISLVSGGSTARVVRGSLIPHPSDAADERAVGDATQDAQVDCFANAASHLDPGGSFVVEVGVPQLRRLPPGERANVFALGDGHVGIDEFDVVVQKLSRTTWSRPSRASAAGPFPSAMSGRPSST
jgi:hypothetical protein